MRALVSSLLILFFSTMAVGQNADPFGNLGNVMQSSGVMTVEEAFQLNAFENDARLHADFIIAPGMKLYQHKLSFTSDSAQLGPLELPPADDYVDPEFGEVKVYHEMVSIEIPIIRSSPGDVVTIRYQGCSTSICYPPVERAVTLSQHIVPAQPVPQDEATSVPNGHVEATQTTSTASAGRRIPKWRRKRQQRLELACVFCIRAWSRFNPLRIPNVPNYVIRGHWFRQEINSTDPHAFIFIRAGHGNRLFFHGDCRCTCWS